MKHASTLAAAALASALGLAGIGGAVFPTDVAATPMTGQADEASRVASDTWITTKVKAELATTKGLDSLEISVDTLEGVVTLTGVLPDKVAVKKAVAAAESVKGVQDVDSSGLKVK